MASELEEGFFVLEPETRGPHLTDCMLADGFETGDAPRCPRCHGLIGMRETLPPLRMELEIHGQGCGDLTAAPGGDVVVSERFVKAFQSAKLSGVLRFKPVEIVKTVRRKGGQKIAIVPRYFLLDVGFARAAVDEERSHLRRNKPVECAECRNPGVEGVYGFKIERGTWEGEDIFRPRGLQTDLVVSGRFSQWVKDHSLTNVKLTPTEQYWWDPHRMGPPEPATLA